MSLEARRTLASALASLAVLAVVVSGVSAAVGFAADADPEADPTPTTSGADVFLDEGLQVLYGDDDDNATLLVPDGALWELRRGDDTAGFSTPGGDVTIDGPATYDEGFCPRLFGVPRAFVGFADADPADGSTPEESATATLEQWVAAARVEEDGTELDVTGPTDAAVELDDGTAAWTAAAVVVETDTERCGSDSVEIRVVSAVTGAEIANVVMVRGVDAEGGDLRDGLDAATVDDVLRSLKPR